MSEASFKKLAIERERKIKDEYFKEYPETPIPPEDRDSFLCLSYYPVNSRFRFRVRLQPYKVPEIVRMITGGGAIQQYIRVGFFEFSVEGTACRLEVYKSAEHRGPLECLFIPLRDRTSGIETYGAARYLDIPENENGTYELDFNKAYNPYCAYNERYVCPVAPKENWLAVEIRAGEMKYLCVKNQGKSSANSDVTGQENDQCALISFLTITNTQVEKVADQEIR